MANNSLLITLGLGEARATTIYFNVLLLLLDIDSQDMITEDIMTEVVSSRFFILILTVTLLSHRPETVTK